MLSKTGFTHSDLLCWQIDYAGGSLNVNGTIMRDTYSCKVRSVRLLRLSEGLIQSVESYLTKLHSGLE
ncbi:hypothetical protein EL009_09400 [Salmonella enterica subsp. salamae serovar 42:r:-]|nr:hypothetical protein ELZ76_09385 [Salmonella enterica subsp. salamae serovar 42:r:-]AZT50424.1 hypothetical protein EL003_09350 [Salmonella enterica subsp. salamae serovar 42:r:-]AZT54783.1 hypothetical protein EL009_09400 [Salmonella enterica subsp. salamae serovar 42:r:-]EAX2551553.1 hypothetical protein [Salmonella enterica]EAY7953492.1 hypothetical protein [Salmonella enterica]